MPETGYIAAVLGIVFVITLALRAVGFAVLKPLRKSKLVQQMTTWMPVGILAILTATTLSAAAAGGGTRLLHAMIALLVTAVVHLVAGRRTLLSVGAGTLSYVLLVTFF